MEYQFIVGLVAAGLLILGAIPYFWDAIYGTTKPNRVTWFGWALIMWIACAIQYTDAPNFAMYTMLASACVLSLIFVLSLFRGVSTFTTLDGICLTLGVAACALWVLLDASLAALLALIAADILFATPSIQKTWHAPESESSLSWFIGALATGLAVTSIGETGVLAFLYPGYLFLINFVMFLLSRNALQRITHMTHP